MPSEAAVISLPKRQTEAHGQVCATDPCERCQEAMLRAREALDHLHRAQDELNAACSKLSGLVGAIPQWKRAGALADQVRTLWYRVNNRQGRYAGRLLRRAPRDPGPVAMKTLTVAQAAALACVTRHAICDAIEVEELPAARDGRRGRLRIRFDALQRWMAYRAATAGLPATADDVPDTVGMVGADWQSWAHTPAG
jgi:excisionase family DNA binding protein